LFVTCYYKALVAIANLAEDDPKKLISDGVAGANGARAPLGFPVKKKRKLTTLSERLRKTSEKVY